jgi:hypothetical protein
MLKRCARCKQEKPVDQFNKNRRRPDGLQSNCRPCCAAYFQTNRDRIISQIRDAQRNHIARMREFILEYLSAHPCVDCGEADPLVLDFDHVTGQKRKAISRLVSDGHALQDIKEEIAKCEVRCANCHRRRTAKQLGYITRYLDHAACARQDGLLAFTQD